MDLKLLLALVAGGYRAAASPRHYYDLIHVCLVPCDISSLLVGLASVRWCGSYDSRRAEISFDLRCTVEGRPVFLLDSKRTQGSRRLHTYSKRSASEVVCLRVVLNAHAGQCKMIAQSCGVPLMCNVR